MVSKPRRKSIHKTGKSLLEEKVAIKQTNKCNMGTQCVRFLFDLTKICSLNRQCVVQILKTLNEKLIQY